MQLAALMRAFISTTAILETSPFRHVVAALVFSVRLGFKGLISVTLYALLRTCTSYVALLRVSSLALLLCTTILRVSFIF